MYYPTAKFGDDMSRGFCLRVLTHAHIHTQVQSRWTPYSRLRFVGMSNNQLYLPHNRQQEPQKYKIIKEQYRKKNRILTVFQKYRFFTFSVELYIIKVTENSVRLPAKAESRSAVHLLSLWIFYTWKLKRMANLKIKSYYAITNKIRFVSVEYRCAT